MPHGGSHETGDTNALLTLLAGGLSTGLPGISQGIARSDQAESESFQLQQNNLLRQLERRDAAGRAEAVARQKRRDRLEKTEVNVNEVRNILSGEVSRVNKEVGDLEKLRSQAGGNLSEDDQFKLDRLKERQSTIEAGQTKFTALAGELKFKNPATKRLFANILGSSPDPEFSVGRIPASFQGIREDVMAQARLQGADQNFLRQVLDAAEIVFVGDQAAFESPFSLEGAGPAAQPGGLPATGGRTGFPEASEAIQNISPSFLDEANEIGALPSPQGRAENDARRRRTNLLVSQATDDLLATFGPALPQIEDTSAREKKRREGLQRAQLREFLLPLVRDQIQGAVQTGNLPPPEDPALGEQALLPTAVPDFGAVASLPSEPSIAAPPPPGAVDLTTVATPGMRDMAMEFARREGASQDTLDLVTDLMDALVEDEDTFDV